MSVPTSASPIELSRLERLRAMHRWTVEGAASTAQGTLTGGAFLTGFALYLHCNDFVIGILAAIPAFVGLLQLFSSYLAERYGERRLIVSWFSFSSRLLWIPILLIPFALPSGLWVGTFLTLILLSSALINVSNPLWMAWITDLVPADIRGRYFGRKNMYGGFVGMVVAVIAGAFLDTATKRHMLTEPAAFAVLFGTSSLFALWSFRLALSSPDVSRPALGGAGDSVPESPRAYYAAPFADPNFRRFMWFSTSVVVAQTIAGQFFTVYQLKSLALNYTSFQLLAAVASLASLAAMPFWGYLSDKYGSKPILMISCLLTIFAPFLWLLTYRDGIPGLWAHTSDGLLRISWTKLDITLLNLMSGFAWAGVGLAQFNLMIGAAPAERRSVYVSAIAAVNGIAGAVSPLAGGVILEALSGAVFPTHGLVRSNYHVLFIISGLLRFSFLLFLRPVQELGSNTTGYVLRQLKATKPIGSIAGIQKLSRASTPQDRKQAVDRLGQLKTPVAVEELVHALDDVALPVRERAAAALGEIGDSRATAPLLQKLADPAAGIEGAAARALGKIGDQAALPALAAATQLGPLPRQLAAMEALTQMADPRVTEILMSLVAEPPLHLAALRALGEREDLGSLPLLLRELDMAALPATVAILADALGRIGDLAAVGLLLAALLRTDARTARREILNALGSLLGGRDSFYPYLAMDANACDETVSKILLNLQRRFRAQARSSQPGAARRAVRARQALLASVQGDEGSCLHALAQMVWAAPSLNQRARSAAIVSVLSVLDQMQKVGVKHEEVLLAVFLVRLMADVPPEIGL